MFWIKKTLESVYYVITFILSFTCLAQNTNSVKTLQLLQEKPLEDSHKGPLFKDSKILESFNRTALEQCIFINKSLRGLLSLSLIAGSYLLLSLILTIIDAQILIFNDCKCIIYLELLVKLPSRFYSSSADYK